MTRPLTVGPGGLFFLPQRPYLTEGTLKQQLLYPDVGEGSGRVSDEELVQVRACGAGSSPSLALLDRLSCLGQWGMG